MTTQDILKTLYLNPRKGELICLPLLMSDERLLCTCAAVRLVSDSFELITFVSVYKYFFFIYSCTYITHLTL